MECLLTRNTLWRVAFANYILTHRDQDYEEPLKLFRKSRAYSRLSASFYRDIAMIVPKANKAIFTRSPCKPDAFPAPGRVSRSRIESPPSHPRWYSSLHSHQFQPSLFPFEISMVSLINYLFTDKKWNTYWKQTNRRRVFVAHFSAYLILNKLSADLLGICKLVFLYSAIWTTPYISQNCELGIISGWKDNFTRSKTYNRHSHCI